MRVILALEESGENDAVMLLGKCQLLVYSSEKRAERQTCVILETI